MMDGERTLAGSRPETGRTGHEAGPGRRRIGSLVQSEAEEEFRGSHEPRRSRTKRQNAELSERRPVKSRAAEKEERRSAKSRTAEPETQRSTSGWREKLQERRKKRIRRTLWTIGSLLLLLYIGVAVYFGFHFYEGTFVYGIDCSQLTVGEVKQEVSEKLGDYVLQIEERGDQTETITAGDIGLEFVDNSSIDRMMRAQLSYIWPVKMLMQKAKTPSVAFSYDKERAKAMLDALNCMNPLFITAPKDAYIETTDTGFEIISEVMGTTLDRQKAQNAVIRALDRGDSVLSFEKADCYINPEIYQDNEKLVSDAAAKNELARAYITYDFGDRQEVVNAPVIENWIVELADGTFVIDDARVTEYVESLAVKYDTFGLTREFYTSLGTTETLTGGDYGWCINQDETVVALLRALEDGYQGTMEPVYLFTAMSRDTNDIGYTYVEICISQQRMWCYENGTCIVDTPVVTGNPNKGNGTPAGGVWAIDAKLRDAILTGEGYTAPVDYWMPFNDDVGIHDLKERTQFGGTIYLSNGSHGCVNTPYDAVQTIYNTVSIGTPVIVYE